ncbi:ABC transporter substrate-binding protein [Arcanobacterium phocae]|uniref:ABC transporter substrate-binding protein n=1 Tax=Arcanobacterium phocae TaxID=131112 RepID=UPI001C0EA6E9|nr:sugar ABC transporter substrate-binding protein [Arcanobacterium phocae]
MKPTFKTWIAVASACVLLVGCSSASGSGENGSDGANSTNSLNLWVPPLAANNQDKALWDEIVEPFEKERGVDVHITVIPWDAYETKYLTGVSSGEGPDVGYMYSEMIGDYISKDQLVDLSSMVTQDQKDSFYFLKNGDFDGKQYSIPLIVGGARVLFYNKDLLDSVGVSVPQSWSDFADAGIKLKRAGIKPFATAWGDSSRGAMNGLFFPFVWQAGGELFERDGSQTRFNSKEVLEAATFIRDLRDSGVIAETATGSTPETQFKDFASGNAAFIIDSDQRMKEWTDAGINWGFVPSLKGKQEGTFIASDSLTILKKCKNQQLCYDLISFITSGPQMEKLHTQATFPPIAKDERSTYPEQFAQMYVNRTNMMYPLPVIPNGTGTYQVLYENLQQMLNGQKTPEQALNDATEEANAMLKR